METIENIAHSYGELKEYVLIRDKDQTGKEINLLLTEHQLEVCQERAKKMAEIIPQEDGFLSRWFG